IPVVNPGEPSTTIVVDTPSGPTVIDVPVEDPSNGGVSIADIINDLGGFDEPATLAPATTVIVDTPTGPTVIEIPPVKVDEPTTSVIVDTPTGPTVIEIPIAQPNEPSTTVVIDTPSGPAVIEVPVAAETTAPATTVVIDTPSGPTLIDIPAVKEDEPSTTIVVDTPTGPTVIEIPIASPDEPSTTIVVDTPTGPAVIDVPVDTPVVTPSLRGESMTKSAFKQQLAQHFEDEAQKLRDFSVRAHTEAERADAKIALLDTCIDNAGDKFGWYGVYEDAPHFDNAVAWILNECLVGN
ncbi:hypothetical protein PybrP1_001351, partial [[Pythium] brassicae (nom. inval.)]